MPHPAPRWRFPLFLLVASLAVLAPPAPVDAQDAPLVIYLVRHAERAEDGTNDPPISVAGEERARLLGVMLRDGGIARLHTTDFKRTRQTAAPLARVLALEPEVYDPRDLQEFARALRAAPGRHAVFGHSNTTGELVAALGGDPGPKIEDEEYDRLYIVVIDPDGDVSTVLLRFGETAAGTR